MWIIKIFFILFITEFMCVRDSFLLHLIQNKFKINIENNRTLI